MRFNQFHKAVLQAGLALPSAEVVTEAHLKGVLTHLAAQLVSLTSLAESVGLDLDEVAVFAVDNLPAKEKV